MAQGNCQKHHDISLHLYQKKLVSWIHAEFQRMMVGTTHEVDWYFLPRCFNFDDGERYEELDKKKGVFEKIIDPPQRLQRWDDI